MELKCEQYDDVKHFTAQLVDKDKKPVFHEEREIEFSVEGDYRYHGIDNGLDTFVGDHKSRAITTNFGRAMIIVSGGRVDVTAYIKEDVIKGDRR